jgi:hypothetical protein
MFWSLASGEYGSSATHVGAVDHAYQRDAKQNGIPVADRQVGRVADARVERRPVHFQRVLHMELVSRSSSGR